MAAATAEKNRVYQAEYGANQRARSPERVRALQRKKKLKTQTKAESQKRRSKGS